MPFGNKKKKEVLNNSCNMDEPERHRRPHVVICCLLTEHVLRNATLGDFVMRTPQTVLAQT